jgi:hypothetical protein
MPPDPTQLLQKAHSCDRHHIASATVGANHIHVDGSHVRRVRPYDHPNSAPPRRGFFAAAPSAMKTCLVFNEVAANSQWVSERLYTLLAVGEGGQCPKRVDGALIANIARMMSSVFGLGGLGGFAGLGGGHRGSL